MNKLRKCREDAGLSQKEVAITLGIKSPSVSNWERGKTFPNNENLVRLADLYNVTVDYLTGRKSIPPSNAIPYTPGKLVRVIGSVRCGPGGLAFEEPDGFEPADVDNPDEYFFLRAEGDSMEPKISAGDWVLVRIQDDIESGELAVVVVNGEEGTLKKVIKQAGSIILQAFNSTYSPRVFVGEECSAVRIAGKVVETRKKW